MKLDKVAGSGNDEFYTPEYAIEPLLRYIPTTATVWCPFDTDQSHFVKKLRARGNRVIATHIATGQDFFAYEPGEHYDYIISNPPYSLKNEVFERLFELQKKFAMLVGVVGLFESQRRFELFQKNDFEILYLNKRVAYFKNYDEQTPSLNPPFSSVFLTRGVLPKSIVFEKIQKFS
jgi:hypothetical protein